MKGLIGFGLFLVAFFTLVLTVVWQWAVRTTERDAEANRQLTQQVEIATYETEQKRVGGDTRRSGMKVVERSYAYWYKGVEYRHTRADPKYVDAEYICLDPDRPKTHNLGSREAGPCGVATRGKPEEAQEAYPAPSR